MAYLTYDRLNAGRRQERAAGLGHCCGEWRGFGAEPLGITTPAQYLRFRRQRLLTLTTQLREAAMADLQAQAEFAAQALQAMIAGRPVTRRPVPTDPKVVARIVQARSWLVEWPESELADLFPGLTPEVLAQARRELIPAADVTAITITRLTSEQARLQEQRTRLVALLKELDTVYLPWSADVLKTYQRYATWFQRHLKKKARITRKISQGISAVSSVLKFVPVVGWVAGLVLDLASVGIQVGRFRDSLKAMARAGGKIQAGQIFAALAEAISVAKAEVTNALEEIDYLLEVRVKELDLLKRVQAAVAVQPAAAPATPPPAPATPKDQTVAAAVEVAAGGPSAQRRHFARQVVKAGGWATAAAVLLGVVMRR